MPCTSTNKRRLLCELCGEGRYIKLQQHLESVHGLSEDETRVEMKAVMARHRANETLFPAWKLREAMGEFWKIEELRNNRRLSYSSADRISFSERNNRAARARPPSTRSADPPASVLEDGAGAKQSTIASLKSKGLTEQVDHSLPILAQWYKELLLTNSSRASMTYRACVAKILFAFRPKEMEAWPKSTSEWVRLLQRSDVTAEYFKSLLDAGALPSTILYYIGSYEAFLNFLKSLLRSQEEIFIVFQILESICPIKRRLRLQRYSMSANKAIERFEGIDVSVVRQLAENEERRLHLLEALFLLENTDLKELGRTANWTYDLRLAYTTVLRNVFFIAGPKKAQRPAMILNMQVGEFEIALRKQTQNTQPDMVVFVKEQTNPCKITGERGIYFNAEESMVLTRYFGIRNRIFGRGLPYSYFILGQNGRRVESATESISRFFKAYLGELHTCSSVRKAMAMVGGELGLDGGLTKQAVLSTPTSTSTGRCVPTPPSIKKKAGVVQRIILRKGDYKLLKARIYEEFPISFPKDVSTLVRLLQASERYKGVRIDKPLFTTLRQAWWKVRQTMASSPEQGSSSC